MVAYILIFVSGLLYAFFEGKREAYYYHSASISGDSGRYNIHWLYLVQRIIFHISIFICINENIFIKICLLVSYGLCFSFIHNGSYFLQRNKLDNKIYPKKWMDDSISSTASYEVSFKERTFTFIAGIILFVLSIILKTL